MDGHAQRNEGLHSTSTHLVTKCPHIGLPFLSGRVCTANALGVNGQMQSRKWSDIRPIASDLLDECGQYTGQAGKIMKDPDRWSSPVVSNQLPCSATVKASMADIEGSVGTEATLRWAAHMGLALHNVMNTHTHCLA